MKRWSVFLLVMAMSAVALGTTPNQGDVPGLSDGWGFGWYDHPNPPGETPWNPTMSLGWNVNSAGNPVDPTEPTIFDTWEANWDQVGEAPWVERHWQYRGTDGTLRRPLTLVIPTDTHDPHLAVYGKLSVHSSESPHTSRLTILDTPSGQDSAIMIGTSAVPTYLRCGAGSVGCLQQLSSDGARYVQLIHLDGQNRLNLGTGSDGLRFYGAPEPIDGVTCEERLDSLVAALETIGLVAR